MKRGSQSMKRLLSFIMAFAMVLTMLPLSVFAASSDTITVYFRNDWLWPEVCVHYWGGSASSSWPGVVMEKVGTDSGNDVYAAEIPADSTGMLFSGIENGKSGENYRQQTPDITGFADGDAYYIHWDNGNKASKFTYTPPVVEPETLTVYFRNDWVWSTVRVHYWGGAESSEWPGVEMTWVEDVTVGQNTYGVYSAEIPADSTGILFDGDDYNDNDKTPDITDFADGDAYYIHWDGANKVSKFDYPSVAPEDPPVVEATYIIAGTAGLCGTAWDVTDTDNKMTLNAETGLYEKTFERVAIGTHSFKITQGDWQKEAWGGNGTDGNYEFTLEKISNVTITFNADTKAIQISGTPTGEEPEPVTSVKIHYRNTGLWDTVKAYGWLTGTDTQVLGTWPGTAVTENAEHTNWYTVELTNLNAPNGIGILFNNGSDSGKTGDIMITKNGEYWYDGELLTEEPEDTWEDGSVPMALHQVTLHFANVKSWGSVNLYTWNATGTPTGSWPGTAAGLDSETGFYTSSFGYEAPEGQGLNFIFSGNGQTVDLALDASDFTLEKHEGYEVYTVEKWIVPTDTDSEGKFYADIVSNPDTIAVSPVVNGQTITFAYKAPNATSVDVCGSMNDWGSGYAMTKNEHGVWRVTLENVPYGLHTYKFSVNNGEDWAIDPANGWVVKDEQNRDNSAVLVSDPSKDNNEVYINVHYSNTPEWNVCAWGAKDLDDQYNFSNGKTTIKLDGRANQYVCFKVRKSIEGNDWAEQSGEIRVNLANIVSGTIDVYVASDFSVSQSLNADVVTTNKINSVELDYDKCIITIKSSGVAGASDFSVWYADPETGKDEQLNVGQSAIKNIVTTGATTRIVMDPTVVDLLTTLYRISIRFAGQGEKYADYPYAIGTNTVYASDRFAEEFTFEEGVDLGANWTAESTKFVLWAPTAESVTLNLYKSGTEGVSSEGDATYEMIKGEKGVWTVTVNGDLNGTYYTYTVMVNGEPEVDVVDPYARTTGVNGKRGMVIDLDATDPDGWDKDENPNPSTNYTDAIIYELHVRDFSNHESSGMVNKGKYLAFTEHGTKTEDGTITGIDYLQSMGFTHLHLLPVYDYGSVDETTCSNFNWGYDPVNYNVPEGSYSTKPAQGEVRVNEFKQMVQSLHDAGISVIMDVVYNHVYDAGQFSMNRIVPNYFSRVNPDGSFSNGSGCGNDTASEREMVRKYIVESVLYWHQEYHIDGFRFDLVGLLDATTINKIVADVHACCDDVIFYGEGWTLGTAVEPNNTMATQANSSATPEFAYFSDTIRNLLAGSNGSSLGYVSGLTDQEEAIRDNFMARPWWTNKPTQIVQYASCHDNYTLIDKLVLSNGKSGIDSDIIKMNNLAAAIYMTSQGIPFIHAGEEFLREKLEENGKDRCENSYNASDEVNNIKWDNLTKYIENSDYYKGLIEFRKAHAALRMISNADITSNVTYKKVADNVVMFTINGAAAGDVSDQIVVIFNATNKSQTVGLPEGEWEICIQGNQAGADSLCTVTDDVEVAGISATVLVQGETHTCAGEDDGNCTTAVECSICDKVITAAQAAHAKDYTNNGTTHSWSCTNDDCEATGSEAHDYGDNNACDCGASLLTITATMNPAVNLAMTFTAAGLTGEGNYAVITHTKADGTVNEETVNQAADGTFAYTGLAAKELADQVTVTIYNSEGKAVSLVYTGSARDVLVAQLAAAIDAKLQTLLVDTLNYGAAAQTYFGYNADDLANKDLTAEQQALATQTVSAKDERKKGTGYAGSTLALGNTIKLNFVFNNSAIKNAAKAVFTYTPVGSSEEKTITITSAEFTKYSSTRTRMTVEIPVLESGQLVKCSILDASGNEITSASDSVESYIARSTASNVLYEAILKYVTSAKAYLGK